MTHYKTNDNAFTGLEAAIVLIAFVVVAAVFSYVVLGAGFFTTQKAQEAVYTGVAQATSNIQVVGQVYGIGSGTSASPAVINEIRFSIGLAPGAPTLDISKLNIVFSTPNSDLKILSYGPSATTTTFLAQVDGAGAATPSLMGQQQVQIDFKVVGVPKNTAINMEIRPAVGAALPFAKMTPPELTHSNVLY